MKNIRNKTKDFQSKVWKILLPVTAIFFLEISISKIIIEQQYYMGVLYLITSILYFSSAYLITTGKVSIIKSSANEQMSLILGFTIISIGLAMNGIFWGAGFVLFLAAILSIRRNND